MKHYPNWRINLFVFAGLVGLVVCYFYYQNKQSAAEFSRYSQEHSEILATVVELNIKNALLARDGLEAIVAGSLINSGRFIDYLDTLESFSSGELTAFAQESGFVGLKVISENRVVSGPANFLPDITCQDDGRLQHLEEVGLYLYSYYGETTGETNKCVLIALPARAIEKILAQISVQGLLAKLTDLHDIAYVLLGNPEELSQHTTIDGVTETTLPMGDKQLVVALKNTRIGKRRSMMQLEFFLFTTFLIICGTISSWWLYRAQQQRIEQTREFEQEMARQHEDAALGRAAATITHELRNPLNAIGMGLQRLQLEDFQLDKEHMGLVDSMLESVQRSNTIINRLKQYSDSSTVSGEVVSLFSLINGVLNLYRGTCEKQEIDVQCLCDEELHVIGDKVLLAQLFENLIKNGVEAQQHGGFITIQCVGKDDFCLVTINNGGFLLTEEESRLILEPYFTSKSRGTGLGLVISKKIVEAHGGALYHQVDFQQKTIAFYVRLKRAV